jgi:hypothetical protein
MKIRVRAVMSSQVYKQCKRESANNHLLLDLQEYMINKERYNSICVSEIKLKEIKKKPKRVERIQPRFHDSLFWCFFIAKYGELEYNQVGDHSFTKEKEIKINNIEQMKKNSALLKNYKLSRNKIETDLLNSKKIELPSLYALCLYNNINIIYIKNNCYYQFFSNETDVIHVVVTENKRTSCEVDVSKERVKEIYDKFYLVENISKPIKAISNYKLSELSTIAKYFGIKLTYDSGRTKTKKDIYEAIQAFIQKN